ncbi:MAG: type II toxin-antitoxin system RelE/ParE family toxin [Candidatus Paracaedibacteraceae bacterium]|nr:type II toxin-antitoxin system RelE/ParE family toxin [Candidatus Paracaedibacteraceae bacterium]
MKWNVIVHPKAKKEIEALPIDMRAKLVRILELMQATSPFEIKEPLVKNLGGKLMEIRLQGKDGIARVLYVLVKEKRIALIHAFVKKTQKTPRTAIECALRRAGEIEHE